MITSIGLETTNNQEIKFTDELIQKINDNEKIRAVVFTNAGECVIGVTSEEQCIMGGMGQSQKDRIAERAMLE